MSEAERARPTMDFRQRLVRALMVWEKGGYGGYVDDIYGPKADRLIAELKSWNIELKDLGDV